VRFTDDGFNLKALALALALGACSSSTDTPPGGGPPTVATSVAVTPTTFNLVVGDTLRFSASALAGTAPFTTTFTWGATGGTISSAGLFTAGAAAGAAKVWAVAGTVSDTARGNVAVAGGVRVDTLLFQGFESNSFAIWDDRGSPGNQAIVQTQFHSGAGSLQVTFPLGFDGGWLTKFFMPGYDSIYVSEWVRFQAGWQSGTKLITVYGSKTNDQWSATGKAGVCPGGTDFFSLDVVQERNANPGPTHFYSYYPGMAQSPPGSGQCYGLDGAAVGAQYTTPLEILPTAWHHVEYWIVLNIVGQSNLFQRFCIDGVVRGTWSGISVRSSNILALNAVTISNSIAGGSPQTQQMWVDDFLVTRQRPAGACP
jgi:hypothetical protein